VLAEVRRIVHDRGRDWLQGFPDEELSSQIAALHRIPLEEFLSRPAAAWLD